jgi:hypothetical protein
MKLRSNALRERLGRRRCSGRLLARGSGDHSLPLRRSPQAWRVDLLFGDYLSVPLCDKDGACSSWGCSNVEQQGLTECWGMQPLLPGS